MQQATSATGNEEFIRQVIQTHGYSLREIANRLFRDLCLGTVPAGFEDRALELFHTAETMLAAGQS